MSKLERAYVDTANQTWKKVKAKDGRTMHFKDGTPVTKNAFNGGTANLKYEGQNAEVAVPSNKGPGYERLEVSAIEASALGKELRLTRPDVMGEPQDSVLLGGDRYNTTILANLNQRIVDRFGPDAVFKY